MRFYGAVGYSESQENPSGSGVWKDFMTELFYYGDVLRNTRKIEAVDKLNSDFSVNNSISIIADEYAFSHYFLIKYVRWEGVPWTVDTVEAKPPRLILYLGSLYNGPTE